MKRKSRQGALALLLGLLLALPTRGAGAGAAAKISDGAGQAGEAVTLTVTLADNPGLSGYLFTVRTGTDAIAVESIEAGEWSQGGTFLANPDKGQAMWFSATDKTGDGELFRVTFRLEEGMTNGEYPIQLLCSADDTVDEAGQPVAIVTEDGALTVTGGAESAAPEPEKPPAPSRPSSGRPSGGQTMPVTSKPAAPETAHADFGDLPGDHWAYPYVDRLWKAGVVNGVGEGLFAPENTVTRAEFVTMLHRALGSPEPTQAAPFEDVSADTWYAKAAAWAAESGVVNGTSETAFSPGDPITREQLATVLHRLLKSKGVTFNAAGGGFADQDQIADYAKEGVDAIRSLGIIQGYPDGRFGPKDNATRAAAAKMLCGGLDALTK